MFDKKNKSRKFAQGSTDLAPVTVQAPSVSEQQRQQIEQNLASFDPTWDGSECHMTAQIPAETQEQLAQLVSMFPNGDVRLQTTTGDSIILSSAGGGYQRGAGHSTSPDPYSTRQQDDTEKLSQSQRD